MAYVTQTWGKVFSSCLRNTFGRLDEINLAIVKCNV